MPSKYTRKRKNDLDEDTSENAGDDSGKYKSDRSPSKKPKRKADKGGDEESMSIEETNRVRAELGLAPLEVEEPVADGEVVTVDGGTLFKEDGVEIVHKAAKNWQEDKEAAKLREKLDTQKNKSRIYSKVLKSNKGLGDSGSEDESVDNFLEKMRVQAQKTAQDFDSLDQDAEQEAVVQQKKANEQVKRVRDARKKREDALAAGLVVGHSKASFLDGTETILVLQDKNVLDDDTEETLVNPNMLDNERHKKNVEKRKQKSDYNAYEDEEAIDQHGMVKKKGILSKYDEELDSESNRETFRLDQSGGYDLDREEQEMEMKRRLTMVNKKFETLETPKYTPAREFYTEEEMLTFRKPKKGKNKTRKTRTLKASDLAVVDDDTNDEKAAKAKRLAARRQELGDRMETYDPSTNGASNETKFKKPVSSKEMEEGEVDDSEVVNEIAAPINQKWKQGTGASVDLSRIRSFASKVDSRQKSDDESDEEAFIQGVNLAGIFIDDEAEDELHGVLERTRKLQQIKSQRTDKDEEARYVRQMLSSHGVIKSELGGSDNDEEMEFKPILEEGLIIDATSEQYKMIGEIPTFGLAGNRNDEVDYSELMAEHQRMAEKQVNDHQKKVVPIVHSDDEESESETESLPEIKTSQLKHQRGNDSDMEIEEEEDSSNTMWKPVGADEPTSSKRASDSKSVRSYRKGRPKQDEDKDEYGADYQNALGDERDVTKGVGAMLRLAGEKGYLENSNRGNSGGALKHLESKRFSRVDQGKLDIEDKYIRKLERMGTTGSGPIRSFVEKADYKPNVEISYTDTRGRIIAEKEAFRELSHKFHGKGPGKKQIEKRQAQVNKRERMKQMNSADTPLGTLQKQIKKQEQTQSPFIILTGSNRSDAAQLQKD